MEDPIEDTSSCSICPLSIWSKKRRNENGNAGNHESKDNGANVFQFSFRKYLTAQVFFTRQFVSNFWDEVLAEKDVCKFILGNPKVVTCAVVSVQKNAFALSFEEQDFLLRKLFVDNDPKERTRILDQIGKYSYTDSKFKNKSYKQSFISLK